MSLSLFHTTDFEAIAMALMPMLLLISSAILFSFRKYNERVINIQLLLLGTGVACWAFYLVYLGINEQPYVIYSWFDFGKQVTISLGLDRQGSLMLALVMFVTLVVIVYSTAYMKGEAGYGRYFASLFLFAMSMTGIILSFNLLLTFICWELVGFCSYLLINFWYKKPEATQAARKAFIVNRIGDLGFMMALGMVYAEFGTFEIAAIVQQLQLGNFNEPFVFIAGFGIVMGCLGKSAQFPFMVWLPDAMQAPTPISALLHAATMVAAGVFLLARLMPILPPDLLTVIAYAGGITSLVGAFSAAAQTDLKKILAYSTISQLGYMVAALGAHSYMAPLFHLFSHAMFKACLFLSAGSIIHSMAYLKRHIDVQHASYGFDPQDIRLMGGLRKRMPYTFCAFLLASLAGAGVPLSAGFLSKDEILASVSSWAVLQSNPLHLLLPVLIFSTSLMTAFYTGRMFFLVFFGGFRLGNYYPSLKGFSKYIHEAPRAMVGACLLLAVFCFFIFYSLNPLDPDSGWLFSFLQHPASVFRQETVFLGLLQQEQERLHYWVIGLSVTVLTLGFAFSYLLYAFKTKFRNDFLRRGLQVNALVQLSNNALYLNQVYQIVFVNPFNQLAGISAKFDKKWVDGALDSFVIAFVSLSHVAAWLDKFLIDGIVHMTMWLLNAAGNQLRNLQNGKVQAYLTLALLALLLVFVWMLM